jgi:hypothetical protein
MDFGTSSAETGPHKIASYGVPMRQRALWHIDSRQDECIDVASVQRTHSPPDAEELILIGSNLNSRMGCKPRRTGFVPSSAWQIRRQQKARQQRRQAMERSAPGRAGLCRGAPLHSSPDLAVAGAELGAVVSLGGFVWIMRLTGGRFQRYSEVMGLHGGRGRRSTEFGGNNLPRLFLCEVLQLGNVVRGPTFEGMIGHEQLLLTSSNNAQILCSNKSSGQRKPPTADGPSAGGTPGPLSSGNNLGWL